MRLVADST